MAALSSALTKFRSKCSHRRFVRLVVAVVVVALLPVPWQHNTSSSLGMAWGMDNRLVVNGQRLNPPGRWSWLTAGRPVLVGELAVIRIRQRLDPANVSGVNDLRHGSKDVRPTSVEPAAAAVGLEAADHPSEEVSAAVGGHGPPYSWIRSMAMGSSHGLMVALTTYAAHTEENLAAGRHIAGTGVVRADGTVGRIGGLRAKAAAARRADVDVLLVPASQIKELGTFDPGDMQVLAVHSLDDAIEKLRAGH